MAPGRRSKVAPIAFLDVVRGTAKVVLGTRAAVYAPVTDLGLVAVWDDGDDLHAEPRAPYPHARDVLVHRAHLASCAAVVAGTARTAEAALLVESGWASGASLRPESLTSVSSSTNPSTSCPAKRTRTRQPARTWPAMSSGTA